MAKSRLQTLLLWFALGVGLLVTAILGLFGYVNVTTKPIHPEPRKVPSVTRSAPLPKWDDAVKQSRQILRAGLVEQNLPGISVAVGVAGEVVWDEGFGFEDLESQVAVGPETRFRIGTVSMALTSAAVGLLLEQKRLRLDEKIQTYVPEFPEKQWPVTLRQLMGHTAGVRNDGGGEELLTEHCGRTVDGLRRFANDPLLFEPGTHYLHSSYSWILVSAAVEAAANVPFPAFMQKHVFEPLGLKDTIPDAPAGGSADQATFYFPRFAANPRYGPQPPDEVDYSCFAGSSAFLSTPSDLVRFGMAINSGKLLQPATVRLLQEPQRLASGKETAYGLGWDLEAVTLAGEPTLLTGHDGELMGGMLASLMTFRERDLTVAVISNISFADTASLALKVAEAFAEAKKSTTNK